MTFRRLLPALLILLSPSIATAHLEITSPTPRVAADNIKEAAAPCGGPRGDVVTQLTPGQMLTIEYDETIAHPGHFELNFSMAGDANWTAMDDNIPDQGGVGSYSHTFQVPNVECTDCTFQFVQVMTDRNPPTNYYSCIDVEISAGGNNTTPDMGMGEADMGTAEADMGTTVGGNNQTGNNSTTTPPTGNNSTTPPATNTGGTDSDGYGSVDAHGNACSVTGDHNALTDPIAFLLFGVFVSLRRRR